MENNRDNLIIILAGYKKEMKELLTLNSGLKSRINTYLFFEDYTHYEMELILDKIAEEDDMTISAEARNCFVNQFIWQKCQPSFANGRTVRKIYENAKSKHFYNLKKKLISDEFRYTFLPEDVVDTIDEDNYLS
jgi:Cdc6-like AAA superfamily ATPase